MNYLEITKCDISNGLGIGVCLWVSGCNMHCKGCHNPSSWDCHAGRPFDDKAKDELFKALNKPWVDRLTLTGGHPFAPFNIGQCLDLISEVKTKYPNIKIWVYTGYLFEDLDKQIVKDIDVIVDGSYIEEQRDITIAFRGSRNQRIVDVQQSLKQGKVITLQND